MAGTSPDLSGIQQRERYNGTFSSTANEVDVLTPPWWARSYSAYGSAAWRSASAQDYDTPKTTSDTITDSDQHAPMPATQWFSEPCAGGVDLYFSCATGGATYVVVFYP